MLHQIIREVIKGTGLIVILGRPGGGKSALAYNIIAEKFKAGVKSYVVGLPVEKSSLLPSELEVLSDIEFPEHSAVLCDEGYLYAYSREFMSNPNRFADKFAGLVRQKDILAIWLTQSTRKLDLGLVEAAKAVLIKQPSLLQMKLDRRELRPMLQAAYNAFKVTTAPPGIELELYHKRATYIITDDYEGLVLDTNDLPTFWSEELSHAWRGVQLSGEDSEANIENVHTLMRACAQKPLDALTKGQTLTPVMKEQLRAAIPFLDIQYRRLIDALTIRNNV